MIFRDGLERRLGRIGIIVVLRFVFSLSSALENRNVALLVQFLEQRSLEFDLLPDFHKLLLQALRQVAVVAATVISVLRKVRLNHGLDDGDSLIGIW